MRIYHLHFIPLLFYLCLSSFLSNGQEYSSKLIYDANKSTNDLGIEQCFEFKGELYLLDNNRNPEAYTFEDSSSIKFRLWKLDTTNMKLDLIRVFDYNQNFGTANFYSIDENSFYIGFNYTNPNNPLHEKPYKIEIWYCKDNINNLVKSFESTSLMILGGKCSDYLKLYTNGGSLFTYKHTSGLKEIFSYNYSEYVISPFLEWEINNKLIFDFGKNEDNRTKYWLNTYSEVAGFDTLLTNVNISPSNKLATNSDGIIFIAHNYILGKDQIYKSDGTRNGTVDYYDFIGSNVINISNLIQEESKIFFKYGYGIFYTNSNLLETNIIKYGLDELYPITIIKGKLIFTRKRASNNIIELWITDGITSRFLRQIDGYGFDVKYQRFLSPNLNKELFYLAFTSGLFKYNSTTESITKIDSSFQEIKRIVEFGSKVLIIGKKLNSTIGIELYTIEDNSIKLVKDVNSITVGSYPRELTVFNDKIYFLAQENNILKLIISDGYEENSIEITGFTGMDHWDNIIFNKTRTITKIDTEHIFLIADSPYLVNVLTKSVLKLPRNEASIFNSRKVEYVNGKLIFWYHDSIYSFDLETKAYTLVKRFSGNETILKSIKYQEETYIILSDYPNIIKVYKTNYTENGTYLLQTLNNQFFEDILVIRNVLVLENAHSLWKFDNLSNTFISFASFQPIQDTWNFYSNNTRYADSLNYFRSIRHTDNNMYLVKINNDFTGFDFVQMFNVLAGAPRAFSIFNDKLYFFTYDTKLWELNLSDNSIILKYDFGENISILENPYAHLSSLWFFTLNWHTLTTNLFAFNLINNKISIFENPFIRSLDQNDSYNNEIPDLVFFKNSVIYHKMDNKYGIEFFKITKCSQLSNRIGITPSEDIQNKGSLNSTEIVNPNINVGLFSDKSITLLPGFEVKNQGIFYSTIKSCP
jgi:hypothetical protein